MRGFKVAVAWTAAAAILAVCSAVPAAAADSAKMNFYGYVMMDAGYNNQPIDPAWFDVQRPSKLAASQADLDELGKDGSVFMGVRQTRFGVKSTLPTDMGELRTTFEFELFGTGVDAGQTTFRLRHAYGEMGKWGAGQTWSPFMDIDVFPNTLEYWGPNGMAFFRNVQLRYMPIQGDTRMTIALERPGASGDQGVSSEFADLSGIRARFPLPDLSAEYRVGKKWGYFEVAGMLRQIEWDDMTAGPTQTQDLSDAVTGWGVNLSSNLKLGPANVVRLQFLHGEGVENYMNDAPVDVGTKNDPSDLVQPVKGVALPVTGIVAFLDHTWNEKYSSSIGYSRLDIDNSDGQAADAFKVGQYMLANVLYTPVPNFMCGIEGGWIQRENKGDATTDGFKIEDTHIQVSFKYSFAFSTGGQQ